MDRSKKIDILIEALPYISRFNGSIVVIKYGGNAMINEDLKKSVMQDVLLMKSVGIKPIIVHGGGPFITEMLDQMQIESHFEQGLRVTDEATMKIVEMVLAGQVNKDIVNHFNKLGGNAVGLSGKDGKLISAKKKYLKETTEAGEVKLADIGYVGEVEKVNTQLIDMLLDSDFVPVISSIGVDEEGQTYNINADYVAGEIAAAIDADKFILLTDTPGVLKDPENKDSLISEMNTDEASDLIESRVINGGMVPKVECCLFALENGIQQAHIVDGRIKHSLLLELFFDAGIGTMFTASPGGTVYE